MVCSMMRPVDSVHSGCEHHGMRSSAFAEHKKLAARPDRTREPHLTPAPAGNHRATWAGLTAMSAVRATLTRHRPLARPPSAAGLPNTTTLRAAALSLQRAAG